MERSYKDMAACALLWVFGRHFGAPYFYLGRPLHALAWTMTDYLFSLGWVVDMFLVPRFLKDIKSMHASPSESIQQPKASRVISLMAAEVWYAVVCTICATVYLGHIMKLDHDRALMGSVVTGPLGVWWLCKTYNQGLSLQAASVSGVLGYGFSYYVRHTIITQGGPLAELLSAKFLLISPVITTVLANTWLYRTCLSHQLMRLLKGFVKLVLVFLLCVVIVGFLLAPYYKTYRTENNSKTGEDIPRTMTEDQKLLRACEILSVHPSISQDLLTVHYRHLARTWHPDKHTDPASKEEATNKFIQIQDAYEYLSQRVTPSKGKQKKKQ